MSASKLKHMKEAVPKIGADEYQKLVSSILDLAFFVAVKAAKDQGLHIKTVKELRQNQAMLSGIAYDAVMLGSGYEPVDTQGPMQ